MAAPRITPERRQLIIAALHEVGSVNGAARATGHSQGTVRRIRDEEGIDLSTPDPVGTSVPTGQVSREEILEEQVRELRRALTTARRKDVNTERVIVAIEDAVRDVEHPVVFTPPAVEKATDVAHHRQLVMWSDFHGGENVDPETLMGVNDYDWSIMEQRVDEMLTGILSHKKHSPPLLGLDIALVGDMNSGSNHLELATTNEYPLAEQGIRMGYLIGRAVEHLAPHFPEIRVLSVVGNHPRLVKPPAAKDTHDNMDWVSAVLAKEYLKNVANLSSFVPGRTSLIHEIAGRNLYLWHGDGIRSSMPGVPWGGVMRRVNEIARQYASTIRIDHYGLGHFHDPNVVQGGRILMNGSLKGPDEWVAKNFGGGTAPTQLLTTFDERASRLTDVKFLTPTAGLG